MTQTLSEPSAVFPFPIHSHHQRAAEKAVERFRDDPEIIAIIWGGSVPKNLARVDSDIDIMLVVSDSAFERYDREGRLSFLLWDICEYPGGYVDVKVFSLSFLKAASERGSEPTRNSFVAARVLFTRDEAIPGLVERIAAYPLHLQRERIISFYSQVVLVRVFFWPHAHTVGDVYLKTRSASDAVLYGFRLLLVHNRVFFPCHKSLRSAVAALPEKPEGIVQLADDFLSQQTEVSMRAFCNAIEKFTDWGITPEQWSLILTRFQMDTERAWFTHTPALSDI